MIVNLFFLWLKCCMSRAHTHTHTQKLVCVVYMKNVHRLETNLINWNWVLLRQLFAVCVYCGVACIMRLLGLVLTCFVYCAN